MQLKFLKVGCADGICINFIGNDGFSHNIFIDGGVEKGGIYPNTLKKEIERIVDQKEIIDLWIITHIDDDHIGGVLRFLSDESLRKEVDLTKTKFWFNYSNWDYEIRINKNNLKSVRQGMKLRDFLINNAVLEECITNASSQFDLFGVKMTVLSPSKSKYDKLLEKWKKEEIKIRQKESSQQKTSKRNDYLIKIEDFDLTHFQEDDSEENGSSIAFLLEHHGKKVLFLADSHPNVVNESLEQLGYSPTNKIKLDYVHVAHHGSKHNINDHFLQIINCQNFIVSSDGLNKHNLPNKEALARIVKQYPDKEIKFFITHKNSSTTSIFDVDKSIRNVKLEFPESSSNHLLFHL